MKNQYMIVKHTERATLYYNEEFNIFSVKHGTIYTNQRKANSKMKYATKYASGSEISGYTEVIKIR